MQSQIKQTPFNLSRQRPLIFFFFIQWMPFIRVSLPFSGLRDTFFFILAWRDLQMIKNFKLISFSGIIEVEYNVYKYITFLQPRL